MIRFQPLSDFGALSHRISSLSCDVVSLLLLWVGENRTGCVPAVCMAPSRLRIPLSTEEPRGRKIPGLVFGAPKGEERKNFLNDKTAKSNNHT